MSGTLLMILNPRNLSQCMLSLENLPVPKVWLKNYTEGELVEIIPQVIELSTYDHFMVVSDDCIVNLEAYWAVIELIDAGHPIATGFCNLDPTSPYAALTKTPFRGSEPPTERSYDWYDLETVRKWPAGEVIPTHFAGMAFTCMSRELWRQFPWGCFGLPRGWAADYHLALRLRDAKIPIVSTKRAYIFHTKPDWKVVDTTPGRELRVGIEPAEVVWDV